jgi:hypothetical protein
MNGSHICSALLLRRDSHRSNEEAATEALIAVGLQHFSPLGHFNLGVALARLGQRERAMLAFETSLTMLPGLAAAHRWLGFLYAQPGGDAVKAARHRYLHASGSRCLIVTNPMKNPALSLGTQRQGGAMATNNRR